MFGPNGASRPASETTPHTPPSFRLWTIFSAVCLWKQLLYVVGIMSLTSHQLPDPMALPCQGKITASCLVRACSSLLLHVPLLSIRSPSSTSPSLTESQTQKIDQRRHRMLPDPEPPVPLPRLPTRPAVGTAWTPRGCSVSQGCRKGRGTRRRRRGAAPACSGTADGGRRCESQDCGSR